MQTFLPHADFARSAEVLDPRRLGKQRVETLQVLRSLELPDYGWGNHPAVRMWRGRTAALVVYGLTCVDVWTRPGRADTTRSMVAEFAPEVDGLTQADLDVAGLLPSWLGHRPLHLSHRSALLRKDPATYRPLFGADDPDDLPYVWPDPDPLPPPAPPVGRPLWVVRAPGAPAVQYFLDAGRIALDTGSGIDVDVRGRREGADLRDLLAEVAPGRRPGKPLRQLTSFVEEVRPGDEVALLLPDGDALTLGTVTGEYAFDPHDPFAPHGRSVRWENTVPRGAVERPALLQDPRALFRVTRRP